MMQRSNQCGMNVRVFGMPIIILVFLTQPLKAVLLCYIKFSKHVNKRVDLQKSLINPGQKRKYIDVCK